MFNEFSSSKDISGVIALNNAFKFIGFIILLFWLPLFGFPFVLDAIAAIKA